jgi:restriction endonuclease S subunit
MLKLMSNLLQFIRFNEFNKWSVKNNLIFTLFKSNYEFQKLEKLIKPRKEKIKKSDYKNDIAIVKKISFKDGKIHIRDKKETGMDMYNIYPNDLLVSKINFHQGALSLNTFNKNILSSTHYQPYTITNNQVLDKYLVMVLRSKIFQDYIEYLKPEGIKTEATFHFIKELKIPLPSLEIQKKLVQNYQNKLNLAVSQEKQAKNKEQEIEEYLYKELGIEIPQEKEKTNGLLEFINFKDISIWSYEQINSNSNFSCDTKIKCDISTLENMCIFKKKPFRKKEYEKSSFNYIDIGSINPLIGITETKKISISKTPSRATQHVNTGDLIIATTRPYLRKFAIVDEKFNNDVCSSGFAVLKYNPTKYNLDFIKEFLQSFYGIKQLKEKMTGGLYPAITSSELKTVKIPNPDIEIQNKITVYIKSLKDKTKNLKEEAIKNKKLALKEFEKEIFNEA